MLSFLINIPLFSQHKPAINWRIVFEYLNVYRLTSPIFAALMYIFGCIIRIPVQHQARMQTTTIVVVFASDTID